jgi:hypothetical protein
MTQTRATQSSPLQDRPEVPAAELHYAPAPPFQSTRTIDRALVTAVLVVTCVLAAILLPRAWRHMEFQRLISRCANYSASPETVVFEENTTGMPVSLVPVQWQALHQRIFESDVMSRGTAFLGARRAKTSSGAVRLVSVDVIGPFHHGDSFGLEARLIDTSSSLAGPKPLGGGGCEIPGSASLDGSHLVRVYAGQADPADESHFTIEVETAGERVVIDGWVRNDRIVMEPRDTLATRPAPSSRESLPTSAPPATRPSPGLVAK